jgi:signal transduction histidine kinase
MNHAISSLAKTEIIKQLGCFPAFLTPAIKSSLIYQSLVQQTLFAYINNPLPSQFKEKLFVVLSRYFGISYFTICHSCTLRSLGISATEILALEKLQYPQSELEVAKDLEILSYQWRKEIGWQKNSETELSLLRCSTLLFLHPEQTASLSIELQKLLGTVYYNYLVVFLGYIKLCHQWVLSNQNIEHQQDRRSQLHLGSLLLENIKLAQFFTAEVKSASPLAVNHVQAKFGQNNQDNFDISDFVHQETKLAEVEAKLRLVLEATKTGNWSWDLTTNQVDVCHRGRTILGLENFDGSYESFLQSISSDQRESVDLEIAKAIQAHQELSIKYCVVKPNQKAVQIHTKGKLSYSAKGQAIRLTGVVIDITSNNQSVRQQNNQLSSTINSALGCDLPESDLLVMQENAVQSLSELRTVIDLLPYFLFVVDVSTNSISFMNSGLASSLKIAKDDASGKTIAECFSLEYAQKINWQHQQVTTYKQVVRIQEEVILPDGIHYFDTVVTPLYDADENIYALLHTSSDIPDLAATQEALSQRTIQLEAANRELESFSYSVSHDLQAPLRVINGFSQVLWENYLPNLDDRGKHYLQRIQANSKRMSDLIDALLQLSRVTRSQMKPVKVNLTAIAQDIIEELQAENPQRQVEVKLTPDLETKGDPQLLRIVLCNLLHNAWKYTSKRSHPRIEFGIITDNVPQPTYFIKDNGAGFDQTYVDKLFTAFQRLHSQAEFPGTGIGLATVQRIIYRHGGKVWAEGECDRGATIYFSL